MTTDMMLGQRRFIDALVDAVDEDWDRIDLRYACVDAGGESVPTYLAQAVRGGNAEQVHLSADALDALEALQRSRPAGQAEHWTWLEFSIDATGSFRFDYKYGASPAPDAVS